MIVRIEILLLAGLLGAAALEAGSTTYREARAGISAQSRASRDEILEKRLVVRVIDGDTIVVSPNEKVRLIGVDTQKPFTRKRRSSVSPRTPRNSPEEWLNENPFAWCSTSPIRRAITKIAMAEP